MYADVHLLLRSRIGSSWRRIGSSLRRIGNSLRRIGSSWRRIGSSLRRIGSFWRRIGSSWRRIGSSWRRISSFLRRIGSSWRRGGSSLRRIDSSWRRIGSSWWRIGRVWVGWSISTCLRIRGLVKIGWWWLNRVGRISNWLGWVFSLLQGRCVGSSNGCSRLRRSTSWYNTNCPQWIDVPADLSNTHPKTDTDAYRDENRKDSEDDEGNDSSCNDTTNYRMIRKEGGINSSDIDTHLEEGMAIL